LEAKENKDKGREAGRPWNGEFGMRNAECGMKKDRRWEKDRRWKKDDGRWKMRKR
jgi:hypothetical protein